MLSVDSFPGYICGGRPTEIDGVVLQSSHSSFYANDSCVKRFLSDDNMLTSKRLMLKFERFSITDRSVELKILGTSGGNVRSFHCFIITYCVLILIYK